MIRIQMNRSEVIARLKAVEPALRARGIGALYLFGSYSRDEASSTSDIDVFVDADDDKFFDLSNFMGAYNAITAAFSGSRVDYATRESLSKYIRPEVERNAIRVF